MSGFQHLVAGLKEREGAAALEVEEAAAAVEAAEAAAVEAAAVEVGAGVLCLLRTGSCSR